MKLWARLGPEGPYCCYWIFAEDGWTPRNIWHRFFCGLCKKTTRELNRYWDDFREKVGR